MAGIIFSYGKNVKDIHKILHEDHLYRKNFLHSSFTELNSNFCISKFGRNNEKDQNYFISDVYNIICLGTVIYKDFLGTSAIKKIAEELNKKTIVEITRYLDGHYLIFLIDKKNNCISIITDHAGMFHAYVYREKERIYVSTSSYILGKNFKTTFNYEAIGQFLRCDTIYDLDTIYNEIELLEPATIFTYQLGNEIKEEKHKYWNVPSNIEDKMTIEEAVELWAETLLETGKIIGANGVICDLTGGYDSRLILASLLPYVESKNTSFTTFCFGPLFSPDVVAARNICKNLQVDNLWLDFPPNWNRQFCEYINYALSITDGDENIFNYAPILYANKQKKEKYSLSVNGMGGCFVKSHSWAQELSISKKPANIKRFVNFKNLQYEYDNSVHSIVFQNIIKDLPNLLSEKFNKTISELDIYQTYNTLQLDTIRLYQKERRWGGRTISSSNQIINVLAPLYFKKSLSAGFLIPPHFKKNGLLLKRVATKINPELAAQKMSSGLPCEIANFKNFYKYYPILPFYAKKILKVLFQQFIKKTIFLDKSLSLHKEEVFQSFYDSQLFHDIGSMESWISGSLYQLDKAKNFLNNASRPGFRYYPQIEKMISLELKLRSEGKKFL
ncbi:MAG: hypothetical protein R2940_10985 [Syntrophotaleaceae bacterium]